MGNTIKRKDTQLQLEIIHPFWFFGGYPNSHLLTGRKKDICL